MEEEKNKYSYSYSYSAFYTFLHLFFEKMANFRNLSVPLRQLQSKLSNPNDAGRLTIFTDINAGEIMR
jgi:hypothetical protein